MISSDWGRGAATMLVREEARDRQIWMTAVGMPIMATVLIISQLGRKALTLILMMDRPLR